jgi:hypothetical protein
MSVAQHLNDCNFYPNRLYKRPDGDIQLRESMTLRIQKSDDREVAIFALTGRIEKEYTVELQRLIDQEKYLHNIVLDLKEVKLVDRDSVQFLMWCESEGIKLTNCPAYIREWILRERDVK